MSVLRASGLVLQRKPFREHDLRVTLLLDDDARLEVFAPSGQRSQKRFTGGLSPLALYDLGWSLGRQGARLEDAQAVRAWPGLLSDLRRQTAALIATAVIDGVAEPVPTGRVYFPMLVELYGALSDKLVSPRGALVRFVFEALDASGHEPQLARCVRCERPCPDEALVTLDFAAGGVVCRSCGGGPFRLSANDRADVRAVIAGALDRATATSLTVAQQFLDPVATEAARVLGASVVLLGDSVGTASH